MCSSSPSSRAPPEDEGLPASAATGERCTQPTCSIRRGPSAYLGLIERLAEARGQGVPEDEDRRALRGEIFDSISIATLDLASTVAHIGCKGGARLRVAGNLRDAEAEQIQRLTAFSLMVSAAGAVASGALNLGDKNMTAASVVGIGGGVAGGVLGFATLGVHRTAAFRHDRNILAQVWPADHHPDFPDAIWAYLTRKAFGTSPGYSIRESLAAKWKASKNLGDDAGRPSADRIALYFGAGGIYDADRLGSRAEMVIELRDVVDLIDHDLRQLETDVSHR